MEILTCKQCQAELAPQTSFCRQCGAAIDATGEVAADERPTALLHKSDTVGTRRLEPRQTGPDVKHATVPPIPGNQTVATKVGFNVLVVVVFIVVILVSTFAFMKTRSEVASSEGLVYPGARIDVDVVAEGGGRAVQLETSDSMQKVEEWYRNSMKPGKVIQLTPNSVVLKNEKATTTIVREDNKTSILIKIVP